MGCFQNITVGNKKLLESLAIIDKSFLKSPYIMTKYIGRIFTLRYENPELRNMGPSCRLNEPCLNEPGQ